MSELLPALPTGYRARPASAEDLGAVHRLVAACEHELYGRPQTDAGGVAADFARPGLVPASDTLLVHDPDGRLAAHAWVNRRSKVDVHPGHRGRGLGAALLDWAEARARQADGGQIVQTVPDGDTAAVALLRSRGYQPMVTEWLLEFGLAEGAAPAVPEPPEGITVRPFRPGGTAAERDARAAHRLVQDAFDEWQPRRMDYEEWARHTVERPAFAPAMSVLAFAGDQLVGAAIALDLPDTGEGYLEQVAVRRDHRNRGIARLLLRHAFRTFQQRGRRSGTLWTHSNTGALDLYLRVGMTVRHSSTVHRKGLGAARPSV
ncbi:GNAT family N-acetyltransferase [Kitasatospora sp. CM 4170]|uniref:GNAT family N-acetyltransferase n=1 Tax=Kitasatospora aburaviensis TaxID=67265 RepID=A0ABW1F5Q2_9ACTN|nr:GNAT family N-acetyltransferase [Kitasatospora sp. CM 4170]WNM43290.1 GNAT family N-acetyltransferase [Kitasatospora sp. CM 4170]